MKNIKKEILVWVQLITLIGLWVLILLITNTPLTIDATAIKKLPEVVTAYVVLSFIFTTWLWKWRIFKGWLIPYPNLNGTWRGELKSTWINPETNEGVPPIPVLIVIKQSFEHISCVMFTAESESFSTTAQINEDDDSGILRLSYNYSNTSKATIRHRSEIHNGAAILKVVTVPKPVLEGEYWTGRKTTGEISVSLISRKHYQKFTTD